MIQHTVVLKLKYPKGSPEEKEFLAAAAKLALIPGVHNFQSLRQIGKKNDFDYGLSMEFDNMAAYSAYNIHPDHNRFVATYWAKYVEKFLELDYEPII
ncbi:Dabb family protein [Arenibacter sp. ARW7G5Y1]|uniref:Dabb family protein n=1 Tax=Arenibacter sp. ARW7G5Y1 TaxID=2135619 RepID=UPI000D7709BE|nr:Dabb family protein [Arenibacter sp. ARW7G5Y1]PXX26518.1 stress responsive alpha/beta barrel protein [Arenibacter sp. ARW7G5Y1]|tara:strand:+ start:344 stop:637 length:294 start_codon:yes stop_codon:yes gene_type:complete